MADTLKIPLINPIRIRHETWLNPADYPQNNFTPFDQQTQRAQYDRGVTPQKHYYPNWLLDQELVIQVISTNFFNPSGQWYDPDNNATSMTRTDVTPSGWTAGETVFNFSFTPTIEGVYYFKILEPFGETYISDQFYVKSNDDLELVEFRFADTQNRYGGVFYDSTSAIWEPRAYYTKMPDAVGAEDEQSVYKPEGGGTRVLQSDPTFSEGIILSDIHRHYYKTAKLQSVCDTFYINDIQYSAPEFTLEQIDPKGDLLNITIKADLQNNDYYSKFS